MKRIAIATLLGLAILTGCSSDNKSEELEDNRQNTTVKVDSQNQVEEQNDKEKWIYLAQDKELNIIVYYDENHIETIESDGSTQNHKKITLKGLSTLKKNKNKDLYMDIEFDCAGKTRTVETKMFENGKLLWTKNGENTKGYSDWVVIDPNADEPEALTEPVICKQ